MTSKQKAPISPRQKHIEQRDTGEVHTAPPVEIPIGQEAPARSIAQQIQDQIAIQAAKKSVGAEALSAEDYLREFNDLEDDIEPDAPWTSRYDIQELVDEGYEFTKGEPEGAPQSERELQDLDLLPVQPSDLGQPQPDPAAAAPVKQDPESEKLSSKVAPV